MPKDTMPQDNILSKIVSSKKQSLLLLKAQQSLGALQQEVEQLLSTYSSPELAAQKQCFELALRRTGQSNIIAEIKRVSPSKGALRPDLDPMQLASEYIQNGAQAISILTEEDFFGGSPQDLKAVRAHHQHVPILRKDFIIDQYQVWEAKLWNASAILLIVSILNDRELQELYSLATELSLDVLFEVHDRDELERLLPLQPKLIGVNNRNLKTFEVSLQTSLNLIQEYAPQAKQACWVSESGIHSRQDLLVLQENGFSAFLIGESLLTAGHPAHKLQELLS